MLLQNSEIARTSCFYKILEKHWRPVWLETKKVTLELEKSITQTHYNPTPTPTTIKMSQPADMEVDDGLTRASSELVDHFRFASLQ